MRKTFNNVILFICLMLMLNISVYAAEHYELILDGRGGKISKCPEDFGEEDGKCEGSVAKNGSVIFPTVTAPSGYNFIGWSTDENCTNLKKSGNNTPTITKKTTFYACYNTKKTIYTITLNGNGTKRFPCPSGFDDVEGAAVGICNGRIEDGKSFTLPTVSENGFSGWAIDDAKNCNDSSKVKSGPQEVKRHRVYYACYSNSSSSSSSSSQSSSSNVTGTKKTINATRWVNYSNNGFKCGQALFIKNCTNNICDAYDVNTKLNLGKISDTYLTANYSAASKVCGSAAQAIGDRYVTQNGNNYVCGDKLYITSCNNGVCNYTKVNNEEISGTNTVSNNLLMFDAPKCSDTKEEIKSCDYKTKHGMEISGEYEICYKSNIQDDELSKIKIVKDSYICNETSGYIFDDTYVSAIENTRKCDDNTKLCKETYQVSCTKGKASKPTLEVFSGNVLSSGKGNIVVKAKASSGKIEQFYYSESIEDAPTSSSNRWIDTDSNEITIPMTPGTIYIWVKDSNGLISYAVSGSVLDNNNTKTTVRKLELEVDGKIQTPTSAAAYNDTIKSSNYVRLSNDLSKDSKVLADGFNPFTMEYKLEVSSPTVTVYATLTSSDSKYVDGYEPRTVNLNYGVNTVLIKIQDNEGKIRTYTILVTRIDDRTSDNTLSDISVSVGNIDFNSNVTEYKVEIPNGTTSVDVTSTISSDKASYLSGYEPGKVNITGDSTVKLIKVKSETGSTRTYVINFVKENKDIITNKTLQLSNLRIPGVYLPFEEEVANYSVSVDYETDVIDVNTSLKDKNSIITFSSKRKSENEFIEGSSKGVPLEVGENFIEIKIVNSKNESSVYRITVIRKEYGLGISDDNTLKDLKVLGYDIDFKPNKKDYTVKIKQEKSLVITAVPNNNRAEVFIRGNEELTGFSTVRVKVVAENGNFETYSIDIKKDAFNKTIELAAIVAGTVIILVSSCIIVIKKKAKSNKEYFEE